MNYDVSRLALLAPHIVGPTAMFWSESARLEKVLVYLRLAGAALFALAFYLLSEPLALVVRFLPFVGGLVAHSFVAAAVLFGLLCALATSALAWTVAKPLRAAVAFACLAALESAKMASDPAAGMEQAMAVYGVLALVNAARTLRECAADAAFKQRARSEVQAAGYVPVEPELLA